MDREIGEYGFRNAMHEGYFCRVFADSFTNTTIHLRPTNWEVPVGKNPSKVDPSEIQAQITTTPDLVRRLKIKALGRDNRPHAVCTVQTFRNPTSGIPPQIAILYVELTEHQPRPDAVLVRDVLSTDGMEVCCSQLTQPYP